MARSASAPAPSTAPARTVRAGAMALAAPKTTRVKISPSRSGIGTGGSATGPGSDPALQDQERHPQDVQDSDRQQRIPAQVHELVEAEARQGPAHPDVDEQEESDLEPERQDL